jgi:hypothetical protein
LHEKKKILLFSNSSSRDTRKLGDHIYYPELRLL